MHPEIDPTQHAVTREQSFLQTGKIASLCSIISLLALTSGASLGQAQTIPPAAPAPEGSATKPEAKPEDVVTLEEFVTTGVRGSAIKAIEVKRENAQFMEAIVSEDIGKFPDNNVVESLQRVPGVQVTDFAHGNITAVTIRGLPDVTTTLNGRNIFTASGLSLSLQDVPASLLNRVDVMKTRSASEIETGMAGVLDIQTFRPFDFAGHKVSVSAKGTYDEQRGSYDPNISALFSNTWKVGSQGKFGALFNASYMSQTYRDQAANPGAQVPFTDGLQTSFDVVPYSRIFSGWTAGLVQGLPTAPGSTLPVGVNGAAVPYVLGRDAIFFTDQKGKTTRPAANLSLQFAPDKNSEYTFEVFYLGYRNKNYSNLLFSFVDWWGHPTANTYNVGLYPGTNIVQHRDYIGDVYDFTSGDHTDARTNSMQYSLAGKWHITPDFDLRSEAVFQDSQYTAHNLFTRAARNVENDVSVNFNAGGGLPAFKYLDVAGTAVDESNVANPATWGLGHLWDQGYRNTGYATTLTEEGTLNVDWAFIKKLKFGLRVDDRKAAQASRLAEGDPTTGTDLATLNAKYPGIVSINSGFYDGRANIPSSWAAINGDWTADNADLLRKLYTFTSTSYWNLKESFSVDEMTSAGYLQVDEMKTDIAGHKLTGQFGVRLVTIKTAMTFTDPTAGSYNQTFGTAGVSKVLPSAALNYEITKNFIARLAYGQTIRRPDFNALNPLITYTRDVTNIGYGTASGGNPSLKPTQSKNYDVALEYYFDEGTMASVNFFKKKIDALVVNGYRRVTYTDTIGAYDYILSQPLNASNGDLTGVEIGGKYFPKSLPSFLQGLGVEGSYTHLKSSQDVPLYNSAGKVTGILNTEFNDVSPDSYSVTLAYERSKLSARLSYAWRSAFHHNDEAALFANPLAVYDSAQRSLTAQISYKLMENLTIDVEGTNLTNDIQHSYYGKNGATTNNFNNWIVGRTYSVTARYSF